MMSTFADGVIPELSSTGLSDGAPFAERFVGHEAAVIERPAQCVESSQLSWVRVPHEHGLGGEIRLFRELAGELQAPRGGLPLEDVEVHPSLPAASRASARRGERR